METVHPGRTFVANPQPDQGDTVSTILIGVDATERSADAIAFGGRLAAAAEAKVIVACAFPYSDTPSRASTAAYRPGLRDDALKTAREMRDQLEDIAERALI